MDIIRALFNPGALQVGDITLPVLISIILTALFWAFPGLAAEQWKGVTGVFIGVLAALLFMFIEEPAYTLKVIATYIVLGIIYGAAAVGLYYSQKSARAFVRVLFYRRE